MVKVSSESARPDSVVVEFDDEQLIANAGLVLVATLSKRLGLEQPWIHGSSCLSTARIDALGLSR